MSRYAIQGICRDAQGNIIDAAAITVYDADTVNLSTIYAAKVGGAPIVGSVVVSDANGHWIFYIDDSDYPILSMFDITIEKPGYTSTTYYDVR